MRRSLALVSFLAVFLSLTLLRTEVPARAQQPPPPPPTAVAEEPLRSAGERPIDIKHLRLDLKVDLPNKTAEGEATLTFRALRDLSEIRLDAVEFTVTKVTLTRDKEAVPTRFAHDGKNLLVTVPGGLKADDAGKLVVAYKVRDSRAGLHFFAPTKANPDVPLTVWSQGEPITNRYWIPCLDQPNQRQSTELVVTVAAGFEVLSNGALVERKENADKTVTFHWLQEKPHPSYLVTLVVGQFDVVREEWNKVPVLYYVPKGRQPDVARTFGRTREMLDFFSGRFGIQYPWDKYAQVVVEQFTSGGMENTSATTLTDRALHDERALLDSSPDSLIAHELAHQWWGDLVTCRDWSHLWLNEGFASYAEALWAEHKLGADEYQYNMLLKGRAAMAGDKERPMVDRRYPFPRSMFDARAYPKGAFVLHMLRQRLGEELFWKGIKRHGTDHRLQSVDTHDFQRSMEVESGRDLERYFYDWTERAGHPTLEVLSDYDAAAKRVRIVVKQTQAGEAFHFILKAKVSGFTFTKVTDLQGRGKHLEDTIDLNVSQKETQVDIPFEMRPDVIEIDPDQGILAEIKETKGRDLWQQQLAEGSMVSRVRAAQYFGGSKLRADREALAKALADEKFWGVQVEIAAALGASGGEPSRDALIAGLKLDHPKTRRACADQLGKFPRDAVAAAALKELLKKGDASYFVEAAAVASYAKLEQADAVAVLLPWLGKASHNEVLSTAALRGLGDTHDLAALDPLIAWTKPGKARANRTAALAALAKLARSANPDRKQLERVEAALVVCLDGEAVPIRMAALTALRDFGDAAEPTTATLEALVQHDSDERVQEAARATLKRIKEKGAGPAEATKLREELDRLKKTQDVLRERLDKYEKLEKKGGPPADKP